MSLAHRIRRRALAVGVITALFVSHTTAQGQSSEQIIRLGTPPNPASFQPGTTTGPVIGKNWDPIMIPAAFVQFTVIMINPLPNAVVNIPSIYGTQLCAFPPIPELLVFGYAYQIYSIPIPNDPTLVGLRFCAQGLGLKYSGAPQLEFYNALDCRIGAV